MLKLFLKIIDEENIPQRAKIPVVIPIHKGRPWTQSSNYRPISLTSTIIKIVEALLLEQMKTFSDKFECIAPSHFGGRSQHSTIGPLIHIRDRILENETNRNRSFNLG